MVPSSGLRQTSLLSFFPQPSNQQVPPPSIHQLRQPDYSDSLTHDSSSSLDQDGDSLTWSQLLAGAAWSGAALSRERSSAAQDSYPAMPFTGRGGISKRRRTPRVSRLPAEKKIDSPLATSASSPALKPDTERLDTELEDSAVNQNHELDQRKGDEISEEDSPPTCAGSDGNVRSETEEAQAPSMRMLSDLEPLIPDLGSSEAALPSSPATSDLIDRTKLESPIVASSDNEALQETRKPLKLKRGACRRVSAPEESVDAPVTEYEREREENIRRNQSFLLKLGISSAVASIKSSRQGKPKGKATWKSNNPPALPLRRSTRRCSNAGAVPPGTDTEMKESVDAPITEYERERDENIRRNQSFLLKLGISSAVASIQSSRQGEPKGKATWKSNTPPALPLRRSTRRYSNAGAVPPGTDTEMKESTFPECTEDIVVSYDDSSVLKYVCGERLGGGVIQTYEVSHSDGKTIMGFQPSKKQLRDPYLKWIYAMNAGLVAQTQRVLLAAGGHQGQIAVFGVHVDGDDSREKAKSFKEDYKQAHSSIEETETLEDTQPLLSWEGSSGWISGLKFLSAQTQENATLLLSSANDGNLVLWDVNKQQKVQQSGSRLPRSSPLKVTEACTIHSNGIFSMHEIGNQVATASKDSTLGLSKIAASEIYKERSISGHHSGSIRGVNFRDASILADCGADGLISVLDVRMPEPCSVTIDTEHATALNMVEWCPSNENLLLSASRDPRLFLHDIRLPKEPLYRLSGHVDSKVRRCSHIYRAAFVAQGQAVATPGQGSNSLSLYSVATGRAISRGFLGYDASVVMWTPGGQNSSSVLWVATKHISQLIPSWHS